MQRLLETHRYDRTDQEGFAALSGDFNPLHVDGAAARREFFGDLVVHGVHGLLRALDAWCAGRSDRLQLSRLRASFPNSVYLDEAVQSWEVERGEGSVRLASDRAGLPTLQAEVAWGSSPPAGEGADRSLPSAAPERVLTPEAPEFEQLAGRCGELPLWLDRAAVAQRFPHATAVLPAWQLAQILAVTRLVGMHCPGLRSILLGARLEFTAPGAEGEPRLRYRVERTLRGASLVQLRLAASGLSGAVDALYRPAPQAQAPFEAAQRRVSPGEFAGQAALVVGGSRGLGEVSAKLIAAGGGRAVITYQRGREDAERVAASIREGGGRCEVLRWDSEAAEDLSGALGALGFAPTHLYYFASPKIFVKRGGGFDAGLFARFRGVYVDGFEAACRGCRSAGAQSLRAFYPSSTALDESVKNLEEYVAAKRAGEQRCAELSRSDPELAIVVRRLPRVATDQTTTFVKHPAADALDVMTDLVREMHGSRGAET